MSNERYRGRVKGSASQADAIARLRLICGKICLALLALVVAAMALLATKQPAPVKAQTIPSNASSTAGCPVPAATFKGWFESGTPSVNGLANPADSLAFSPVSPCSFYQWSEQMFLWLLSPAPASYGGGAHIFDS